MSKSFYGTENRTVQKPFESSPDVRSDLFKLTVAGDLIRLTSLEEFDGGVLDPAISFDGSRVLFSMRRHRWEGWHIWEMGVNGSNLRQVTFDPPGQRVNDLSPEYLSTPNEFAFSSDRLSGYHLGGPGSPPNLFTGNLNTGEVRPIGFNPSGETCPTLTGNGVLLMNRWDHLGDNNQGSIWGCNQDGTGMRTRWGLYGSPGGTSVAGYDIHQFPLGPGNPFVGVFAGFNDTSGKLGLFALPDILRDPDSDPVFFPDDGRYQTPSPIDGETLLYSFDPDEAEGERQHTDYGIYLDTIDMDSRTLVYNATETQ